jgi:hypothetical protein
MEAATPPNISTTSRKHHLDKRADDLANAGIGDDDDLLNTAQTAIWLGTSVQWLEIGRSRQYGPPYLRLGPRQIRYRRGAVRSWLLERLHHCTAEYVTAGGRPQKVDTVRQAAQEAGDARGGRPEGDMPATRDASSRST